MRLGTHGFARFGYGFLEVWSFCMLFSGDPIVGQSSLAWAVASIAVVFPTLLIIACSSAIDAMADHRRLTVAATVLNVVGSLFMLYGASPLDIVGLVVASIGNAWLWVAWGDVYCRLDTESAEQSAMGSALLQVVLVLILLPIARVSGGIAVLLTAPASCLFYCHAIKGLHGSPDETEYTVSPSSRETHAPSIARFVVGIGVPIALMYFWWESPYLKGIIADGRMDSVVILGLLVFMVTFFSFIRFMPNISLPFICRVELSLVVAGTIIASLGGDRLLACVLVYAAIITSQYLNLIYSARLFRSRFGNAAYTFAIVQLVNHAAGWVGSVGASVLVDAGMLVDATMPALWCVICGIAFFAMALMRDTDGGPGAQAASRVAQELAVAEQARLVEIAGRYGLTPRETDVFALLAKGRSAPFIRDELVISLNTVTSHTRRIYRKMNLHSRQELLDLIARQPR